jgi:hypothetical protein
LFAKLAAKGLCASINQPSDTTGPSKHMNEWKSLTAVELLADKPFTDPAHTQQDQQVIEFALDQVRGLLTNAALAPSLAGGQQLFWVQVDGRLHRLILTDLPGLRLAQPLTLVGFFGQRRPQGDHELIDQEDTALVAELMAHNGLLCYCSILLDNGDYGNLVLFRDEEAKLHWSTSERHAYAANNLSPRYYESVRLHNGYLPAGLFADQPPQIERTKYLDYRGMLPWRGVREFVQS